MKGSPQCVLEFDRKHRFALEMLLSELNSTVDTFVLVRAPIGYQVELAN